MAGNTVCLAWPRRVGEAYRIENRQSRAPAPEPVRNGPAPSWVRPFGHRCPPCHHGCPPTTRSACVFSTPEELVAYIGDNDVEVFDIRFCDLLGIMNHLTVPASLGLGRLAGRRDGLRRLVDQGLPVDPRVGHDPAARRDHRPGGSVPPAQDADLQLLRPRPADPAAVLAGPAQRRPQGRGVPGQHRHRRHLFLRRRGRVLHLRQRAVRDRDDGLVLQGRLRRGLVEHRPRRAAEPGLQGPHQGRLLPGAAVRPPCRPSRGHDREPDQHGLRHRARSPRGRRRPGRDQLQVQHPAGLGRRGDAVQVHHQEHRLGAEQDRHLHAEAAVR